MRKINFKEKLLKGVKSKKLSRKNLQIAGLNCKASKEKQERLVFMFALLKPL